MEGLDIELIVGGIGALLAGLGFLTFRKSAPKKSDAPVSKKIETPAPSENKAQPQPAPVTTAPPKKPEPPAPIADKPLSPAEPPKADRASYRTLNDALSKTKESFWGRVAAKFSGKATITDKEIDDLEEILYTSDLGPKTVDYLMTNLGTKLSENKNSDIGFLQQSLREELETIFVDFDGEKKNLVFKGSPTVWMVVGVNGAGKTTTIGKLASQQVAQGKRVLIAAGDTFRAAADSQLKVWADRAEVEIFSPENVKDPSAVAFDALQKAKSKDFDLVIIDTAGRLHTQKNLMEELKKMKRVMNKSLEGSPCETLLVLDANSGQNALMQTAQFHEAVGVTGVILTKMDGSAKGGVAVGIACEHKLPIKMIGVGEKIEDLRPFSSKDFVDSII